LTSAFSTTSETSSLIGDEVSGVQIEEAGKVQPEPEHTDKKTTAEVVEVINEVSTEDSKTTPDNELPAYSASAQEISVATPAAQAPMQLTGQFPNEIAKLVDAMKSLVPPNSVVPTVTSNNNSDIVIDSRIPIWHGDLSRFDRDADYLHMRDRLSNAAYYGQMRDVVDTLAMGEVEYGERWANAPKLS
jgi:hypothetical protein